MKWEIIVSSFMLPYPDDFWVMEVEKSLRGGRNGEAQDLCPKRKEHLAFP